MTNFEYEMMVACGLRKEADAMLQREQSKSAALIKELDDATERNIWTQCCQLLTTDIMNKATDASLSFIRDIVTRLHLTEFIASRRRDYESCIFAIDRELDRRKLGTVRAPETQAKMDAPMAASASAGISVANDMLTIDQAAQYANVDERTIRNWLKSNDSSGASMLPGVIKSERKIRIPRAAIDPWKQPVKRSRKPTKSMKKRCRRKPVKR